MPVDEPAPYSENGGFKLRKGKCTIEVAWAFVIILDMVLVLAKILSICMKELVFLRRYLFGSGALVCFEMC